MKQDDLSVVSKVRGSDDLPALSRGGGALCL